MHLPDHLFFVVFALMYPIAGYFGYQRLMRKIEAGISVNRGHLYAQTISWQWLLFVLAVIVWGLSERPWGELGFSVALNYRVLIGAALTLAGIAFLFGQLRQIAAASIEEAQRLHAEIGELSFIIPRNRSELAGFNMLSLTAGIVEETLWRGFLFWYLGQFVPIWAVAVISAIGFGLAHAYQGLANIPRVTLVGGLFSGLYLLTGSLWLPIILHAAVDILQGRLAYDVIRRIA